MHDAGGGRTQSAAAHLPAGRREAQPPALRRLGKLLSPLPCVCLKALRAGFGQQVACVALLLLVPLSKAPTHRQAVQLGASSTEAGRMPTAHCRRRRRRR